MLDPDELETLERQLDEAASELLDAIVRLSGTSELDAARRLLTG